MARGSDAVRCPLLKYLTRKVKLDELLESSCERLGGGGGVVNVIYGLGVRGTLIYFENKANSPHAPSIYRCTIRVVNKDLVWMKGRMPQNMKWVET